MTAVLQFGLSLRYSTAQHLIDEALNSLQILGFALGRGPLEMPLDALQFGVVQVLPVTPQDGTHDLRLHLSSAARKAAIGPHNKPRALLPVSASLVCLWSPVRSV